MLAFNELGVQYLQLGEVEKTNESLEAALKIAPDAFEPLMNHGIALVRLNRFAEAVPELRAAIKQKDQSPVGHYYLGRALAYQQRYDKAKRNLTWPSDWMAMGWRNQSLFAKMLAPIY